MPVLIGTCQWYAEAKQSFLTSPCHFLIESACGWPRLHGFFSELVPIRSAALARRLVFEVVKAKILKARTDLAHKSKDVQGECELFEHSSESG